MIKSLRQARITDGLPRVVAGQEWVIALSEALGIVLGRTLDYTDESQIYTRLDTASETVLDVLAVNWKIDWYDTSFTLEQKRRTVKSALTVRRLMGTAAAVKLQVDAIYPGATVEEWFQYDGNAGCFRVLLDLPENGISLEEYRRLKNGILTTKNERSHLDVIDIRYECEAKVTVGGCSATSQIIEVWPELITNLEVTGQRSTGGAASVGQMTEVWPELATALEIIAARNTGGAISTGQTLEVWPELAAQVEATAELDEGGATAASQVVEIYPEGGG